MGKETIINLGNLTINILETKFSYKELVEYVKPIYSNSQWRVPTRIPDQRNIFGYILNMENLGILNITPGEYFWISRDESD